MPSRCPHGVAQTTADDLWAYDWYTLQPAASAPPEDPLASACRYVGFQVEWVTSKRDAGLPLGKVLAASRRVFAPDLPWHDAIFGAMATLVYRVLPSAPPQSCARPWKPPAWCSRSSGGSLAPSGRRGERWRVVATE